MVDGLAQECDLDHAMIGELLALVDDVIGVPVDLGPTRVGHDAVGTQLVAAPRDTNVGGPARPGRVLAGQFGIRGDEAAGQVDQFELVTRSTERRAASVRVALQRDL